MHILCFKFYYILQTLSNMYCKFLTLPKYLILHLNRFASNCENINPKCEILIIVSNHKNKCKILEVFLHNLTRVIVPHIYYLIRNLQYSILTMHNVLLSLQGTGIQPMFCYMDQEYLRLPWRSPWIRVVDQTMTKH